MLYIIVIHIFSLLKLLCLNPLRYRDKLYIMFGFALEFIEWFSSTYY